MNLIKKKIRKNNQKEEQANREEIDFYNILLNLIIFL